MGQWCKCGAFLFSFDMDDHKCPPVWRVWCVIWDETEEDARDVYAHSPAWAAEKWAEEADRDGEYEICGGETVRVIAMLGDEVHQLEVGGSLDPVYNAVELSE
jgi:hypothetical protein